MTTVTCEERVRSLLARVERLLGRKLTEPELIEVLETLTEWRAIAALLEAGMPRNAIINPEMMMGQKDTVH